MNSIGATPSSTVPPSDNSAMPQETEEGEDSAGFGCFLPPQVQKKEAVSAVGSVAVDGEGAETDAQVEPKDEADPATNSSADLSFLAACLLALQAPPQAVPVATPECVPEPAVIEADSGQTTPGRGVVLVPADNTKSVAVNTTATPSAALIQSPANFTSSLTPPKVSELKAKMVLPKERSLQVTTTPTEALAPDETAPNLQNVLTSEKFAEVPMVAAVATSVSVKDQSGEAAKNAAGAVLPETNPESTELNLVQSPVRGVIQSTDGIPVATQRQSMPTAHLQEEKKLPIAEKAISLISQSNSADPAMVTAPMAAGSHEKNSDSEDEAPSNGSNLFSPAPSLSAQDTDSGARFHTDAIAKSTSPQETSSIFNHTVEAAERMRSDGKGSAEVQVRLHDGQEVTIQLHMNAGEVQVVIKTNSADLRTALEQNWNQFTTSSADRGLRVAAPVFDAGQSGLGDFQQSRDQYSQQQQQQSSAFIDLEALPSSLAKTRETTAFSTDAVVSSSGPTVLSLFA